MSSEAQQLWAIDKDLPPRRIPKLTYRNHVDEPKITTSNEQIVSHHPGHINEQLISSPVAPEQPVPCSYAAEPLPSSNASVSVPIRETQAIVPRRCSASASVNRSETPPNVNDVKRKKHGSFLGFLSLKEPSTSALDDFARQQQKQAAAKGGKMTAVGLPGISTQKLPPTVPKVNSKWDGLPSPVKDRAKDLRSSRKDQTFKMTSRTSESSSTSSGMSFQESRSSSSSVRFSTPVAQPNINDGDTVALRTEPQDEEDLITSFTWSPQTQTFIWSPQTQRHQDGVRLCQNDSCSAGRRSDSGAEPLASSGSSSHHEEHHVRVSQDTRESVKGGENEEEKGPDQDASEYLTTNVTSVDRTEDLPWDEQNLPIPPCLLPPLKHEPIKIVSSLGAEHEV